MGENVYIHFTIKKSKKKAFQDMLSKLEYKFQDQENSEDIFNFGSSLENFICVVFVPDRNIVTDWSNGYVGKADLNCAGGDGFVKQRGVKVPDTQKTWFNVSINLEECEK
ncbi:hypothetical protein Tco_1278697, partial [Tanacetum coccineum]